MCEPQNEGLNNTVPVDECGWNSVHERGARARQQWQETVVEKTMAGSLRRTAHLES